MSEAAQTGAKSALRGYVGDMMVASRLKGHEVSLPETSNNAGYDLLVDGHQFQVKCYRDSHAALGEHFEKYPDIPVYVNSEVMPAVQRSGEPWAGRVFTVEGYDYETTNQVMEESLAAGADLTDLDVPIFAVAASAARNLHGWWKRSVPLRHLPREIIIDGSAHASLSFAGGFTGAALGGLVFGPAGAVVFGGVGGIAALFGAGFTKRTLRGIIYRKLRHAVSEQADSFERGLQRAMREKIRRKRCKIVQLDAAIARKRDELDREWAGRTLTGRGQPNLGRRSASCVESGTGSVVARLRRTQADPSDEVSPRVSRRSRRALDAPQVRGSDPFRGGAKGRHGGLARRSGQALSGADAPDARSRSESALVQQRTQQTLRRPQGTSEIAVTRT